MNHPSHIFEIAETAHRDQTDLAGKPYIEHVQRVMLIALGAATRRYGVDVDRVMKVWAVAMLHDVIEDAPEFADWVRDSVSDDVYAAVMALTRGKDEVYEDYIHRVLRSGPVAIIVKTADILDHLSRPGNLTHEKQRRYVMALAQLTDAQTGDEK